MIAAVLDTNVLASGFIRYSLEAPPVQVVNAWRGGQYTLVTSEPILNELARTFEEPYFRHRLSASQRAHNLALLRAEATVVPLTVEVRGEATHPEDDLVLATAVSGEAGFLVTGDMKLQKLGSYLAVAIVSPREFLDILEGEAPG